METTTSIAALDFFAELPDPRQAGKALYPLPEIILVSLCAVICGADSFVEFEEFGKAKLNFLRRFLPFEHGIPSHDTLVLSFPTLIQSNLESFLLHGFPRFKRKYLSLWLLMAKLSAVP